MASASEIANESRLNPPRALQAPQRLLVLTQDAELLDTLRAVASDHEISTATAEADLALLLLSAHGGVAVIDAAAVAAPIVQLVERLKAQFPDLVLVVAGGAEDQAALAAQVGKGSVYRFLHKPLSPQRVKLFVDAAWRRHGEEHSGITGLAATQQIPTIQLPRSHKTVWIPVMLAGIAAVALGFGVLQWQRPVAATQTPPSIAAPQSSNMGITTPVEREQPLPASAKPPATVASAVADALPAATPEDTVAQNQERLLAEANEALALRAETITHLARQFNERLGQDKLVEPDDDSAKFYLLKLKQTDAQDPATGLAQQAFAARLMDTARGFVAKQDLAAARRWLAEAREAGASAADIAAVEGEINGVQETALKTVEATADIAPRKLYHVDPDYPLEARQNGTNGWVDLDFTVLADGSAGEIAVVKADPPGLFDKAAIAAVRKWRYEPAKHEGQPVPHRTNVRIRFELK